MFQVYITMAFILIRTEIGPVKNRETEVETSMGTFANFNINYFKNVRERYLIPLGIRQ